MKRYEIVRDKLDDPQISLWYLADLCPGDTEAFEYADNDQWEEYLQRVEIKPGDCILIAYNNGDVDAILAPSTRWYEAVDQLRAWLDYLPNGDRYEIFWRFGGPSKVRKYSKDF